MAPEDSESLSDPFALDDSGEPAPDSRSLRVTLNTQLESGIPPARQREEAGDLSEHPFTLNHELTLNGGAQRLEAVLANQVRTEANLSLLARGLSHLSTSAQAARVANTELMHELDELRNHLTRSHEEEQALRYRMSQLEQLLDVIRHETSRERAFIVEEQDRFLVEIISDHERQIAELQDRLRAASQDKVGAQQLAELTAQRDQAREYATRCERERDLAWQELAHEVVTPKTSETPTERVQRSPSGAATIGSVNLRTVTMPTASAAAPDAERSSEHSATGYSLSGEDVSE